jgi:hypothetical protein
VHVLVKKNFMNKNARLNSENKNTALMFKIFFFENPVFYEITWKKYRVVQPDKPQMTM